MVGNYQSSADLGSRKATNKGQKLERKNGLIYISTSMFPYICTILLHYIRLVAPHKYKHSSTINMTVFFLLFRPQISTRKFSAVLLVVPGGMVRGLHTYSTHFDTI